MNRAYPQLRAFACVPPLVVPDATLQSTIQN